MEKKSKSLYIIEAIQPIRCLWLAYCGRKEQPFSSPSKKKYEYENRESWLSPTPKHLCIPTPITARYMDYIIDSWSSGIAMWHY